MTPDPLDSIDKRLEHLKREAALRLAANPSPKPKPKPKPRPRRRGALVTLVVVVLAVVGGILLVRRSGSHHTPVASGPSSGKPLITGDDRANRTATAVHPTAPVTGRPTTAATADPSTGVTASPSAAASPEPSAAATVPKPGVGEHPTRLLPLPSAPPGTGGYVLLPSDTQPARYDPCRPIHYVIRDRNTPIGGDDAIRNAVAAVSKATGLQFIDDGNSTEAPKWNRLLYQPSRYGDRWAPVLIAWTDPTESPDVGDMVAGRGGSVAFTSRVDEPPVYVSGQIELDVTDFQQMQAAWHGDVIETEVIEHELGHVVGLDHVADQTQIMNPTVYTLNGFGVGDLRGLAYAGGGACHPEL
jgi:hypothetical protein